MVINLRHSNQAILIVDSGNEVYLMQDDYVTADTTKTGGWLLLYSC